MTKGKWRSSLRRLSMRIFVTSSEFVSRRSFSRFFWERRDIRRQLFLTQSPAGEQDAGRKRLSRAFRNRLIALHFDNLPQNELETIIEKKSQLPKSDVRNYWFKRCSISRSLDLKRASLPLPVNPVESLGERSLPLGATWRQVQRSMRQLPTVSRRIRLFPCRRSTETQRRAKVHQGDYREVFRREEEESDDRWRRSLRSWRKSILDTIDLETDRNISTLRAHRLDSTIETIGNARWSCRSFRSTAYFLALPITDAHSWFVNDPLLPLFPLFCKHYPLRPLFEPRFLLFLFSADFALKALQFDHSHSSVRSTQGF